MRISPRSAVVTRLGAAALVAGGTLVAACSGGASPEARTSGTSAAPPDAGGAADAAVFPSTPEGKFRALEADLVKTCGGTGGACHVDGALKDAPRWLAPPDAYASAKAYRGVLPADNDLEHSILLTQIEHTGPALVNSPPLFARVREWIAAELDAAPVPETAAFAIAPGFNTVDLSPVLAGLDGARLVFNASMGAGGLTVAEMRITGPLAHGLRIERPYFVRVPEKGPVVVDPSNGFPGELAVMPGETKDFYSGLLLVPTWMASDRMAIAFTQIHLENPLDAGVVGACKSVTSFVASAVPAFKLDLGGGATCLGCHGGGDDVATNAMDLSAVGTDDARACAQARNYVSLTNKPNSQLIQTPMGKANPVHPITNAPQAFADGVLGWITNE